MKRTKKNMFFSNWFQLVFISQAKTPSVWSFNNSFITFSKVNMLPGCHECSKEISWNIDQVKKKQGYISYVTLISPYITYSRNKKMLQYWSIPLTCDTKLTKVIRYLFKEGSIFFWFYLFFDKIKTKLWHFCQRQNSYKEKKM